MVTLSDVIQPKKIIKKPSLLPVLLPSDKTRTPVPSNRSYIQFIFNKFSENSQNESTGWKYYRFQFNSNEKWIKIFKLNCLIEKKNLTSNYKYSGLLTWSIYSTVWQWIAKGYFMVGLFQLLYWLLNFFTHFTELLFSASQWWWTIKICLLFMTK